MGGRGHADEKTANNYLFHCLRNKENLMSRTCTYVFPPYFPHCFPLYWQVFIFLRRVFTVYSQKLGFPISDCGTGVNHLISHYPNVSMTGMLNDIFVYSVQRWSGVRFIVASFRKCARPRVVNRFSFDPFYGFQRVRQLRYC